MARLFYGRGRGFINKTGFRSPNNPNSFNSQFIRPKFSSASVQFIRKTGATNWTPLPFGVEGGAAVVTAGIIEAANALDSPSAIFTGLAAIVEAANALDSPSAIATLLAAITEAATALDSPNRTMLTPASQTEAAIAADSPSAVQMTPAAIVEAANAVDAPSAIATLIASIIEAAIAVDTQDFAATTVHEVAIVEDATAQDVPSSGMMTPVSIIEALSAEDIVNASYVIIKLYNGLRLLHRIPPVGSDVRVKVGETLVGIPVIDATDDVEGAVRIKVNGVVKALKQAI